MLTDLDLRNSTALPDLAWDLLIALAAAAIGIALALLAHRLLYRLVLRLVRASEGRADDIVALHLRKPTRWAMIALGLVLAARETPLLAEVWQKIAGFVMPALIGWIALAAFRALVEAACLTTEYDPEQDLRLRRRRTRLAIFSRIVTFIIVFVTVGLMLLSIPGVREIGVTLMASAGLAGLAVGAAAQPALKSLIAGLQMALTEPISIGDVVVLDGETGTVEDIKTTYVVLRTWDERRVIVPTIKFFETTFQNWTFGGMEPIGAVVLQLQPVADIDLLRSEFARQIETHRQWDRRCASLMVTQASAGWIEVRLVLSARDSRTLFELQCAIRESMLAWLRKHQPQALRA